MAERPRNVWLLALCMLVVYAWRKLKGERAR